jgi:hypothetical protein
MYQMQFQLVSILQKPTTILSTQFHRAVTLGGKARTGLDVVKEGRGNGVYRIELNDETCTESVMVEGYRKEEKGKLIYEHVLKVSQRTRTLATKG